TLQRGTVVPYTAEDPLFIKIANVGTPVTSLSKPKPGPLKNETLAPWPNPTGGTLYLKQHFDNAEVRLYNLAGKEVGQYNIHFGQPIDVSAFLAGVYLYRAVIDGKAFSGKIIKQ
ncbi:MAG TPA: T9SS type A sorting domain-containing protein, partial [Catalimonadaceae bacterium]|nr:T9SS type A sorting domain-containing protein [Catalimonadaceae bacterium]